VPFPEPVPGLLIRYGYLWMEEHRRGREEGVKDRPCAVILVTVDEDGEQWVTVLPSPFTLTLFCWITLVCDETLLCWITLVCDQAELTASDTVPTTTAAHILYLICL